MFSQLGPLEIVLIIVVLLVVFGPKRLPSLGRSIGTGLREFKDSITGDEARRDDAGAPARPALDEARADQPPAQGAETAPERRA